MISDIEAHRSECALLTEELLYPKLSVQLQDRIAGAGLTSLQVYRGVQALSYLIRRVMKLTDSLPHGGKLTFSAVGLITEKGYTLGRAGLVREMRRALGVPETLVYYHRSGKCMTQENPEAQALAEELLHAVESILRECPDALLSATVTHVAEHHMELMAYKAKVTDLILHWNQEKPS